MGEARRRKLAGEPPRQHEDQPPPAEDIIRQFAERPRSDPMIAVGPAVWGIDPGYDTKHHYFDIGGTDGVGKFRLDRFRFQRPGRQRRVAHVLPVRSDCALRHTAADGRA
jgi:hypothetical protein